MAAPRSPVPGRSPSGWTSDWPYGPMGDSGYSNPFFYHQFADDFDNQLGVTGTYTASGTGTIAHTAGDGGLALFTTGASANNFESIQVPTADFTVPQGALAGKKFFYLVRLQVSDAVNCAFVAGLCNITATPFTAIADGVYFSKLGNATSLNIISVIASTATTTAVPTAAYTLANNTNIDLGFYIDWYGNVNVFVSPNMVGFVPESGTGATLPVRGRVLQVATPTLTTANLSPTLGLQTLNAGAKTMTADFHCAQKER